MASSPEGRLAEQHLTVAVDVDEADLDAAAAADGGVGW
jgi:hypothetical protein